ncbi:replication protein P [Andreprevotia chitinilytica]|uniref:replication protein P n=1 Tax=Andreprevotia chitinilytica TaxID=396808 RepID=UPI00068FF947|nr:replication protein P [Andreprevotia chitinilytica]
MLRGAVAPRKRTGTERIRPIKTLWDRFDGIYMGQWRSRFPDEQAVENWCVEWADGLYGEQVTFAMVKSGLEQLRRTLGPDSYPPTLPQFIGLCKQVPDFEEAFLEAQMQSGRMDYGEDQWSHPAIYWAARDFGGFELRQTTWKASRSRWIRLLSARLSGMCPEVPKRLPKPEYRKSDNTELAETTIGSLLKTLSAKAVVITKR